jgi:dipeptidase E
MSERQIVGIGGARDEGEWGLILDFILGLTGKERPRVCFVPTASSEHPDVLVSLYSNLSARADCTHVSFFPWPPEDLRERVLAQDLIWVSGGNTANMLAIWRVHGFDELARKAWEGGAILAGGSAGMICWFEAGVTDSYGPQLEGMRDGLGLLAGSACPHYDGEERRRPRYRELVENGFPPGIAADDSVALHYVGTELREVVSAREGARAYKVEPGSETPIEPRLL